MVSVTLNNAFFSKILNAYIFITTDRIMMIFLSKCRLKVIWQILSTFGTVEYSTGPMWTPKWAINSTSNFDPKLLSWKRKKLLMRQKIEFFKVQDIDTPIQPRKKKYQTDVILPLKTFQDHLRCLCDNSKFSIFCPPKNTSRGKSHRKILVEGKNWNFTIILETP